MTHTDCAEKYKNVQNLYICTLYSVKYSYMLFKYCPTPYKAFGTICIWEYYFDTL